MTTLRGPGRDTAGRVAPDHVAIWPTAAIERSPDVEDFRLDDGFDVDEWVASVRAEHPDAALAATTVTVAVAAGPSGAWR